MPFMLVNFPSKRDSHWLVECVKMTNFRFHVAKTYKALEPFAKSCLAQPDGTSGGQMNLVPKRRKPKKVKKTLKQALEEMVYEEERVELPNEEGNQADRTEVNDGDAMADPLPLSNDDIVVKEEVEEANSVQNHVDEETEALEVKDDVKKEMSEGMGVRQKEEQGDHMVNNFGGFDGEKEAFNGHDWEFTRSAVDQHHNEEEMETEAVEVKKEAVSEGETANRQKDEQGDDFRGIGDETEAFGGFNNEPDLSAEEKPLKKRSGQLLIDHFVKRMREAEEEEKERKEKSTERRSSRVAKSKCLAKLSEPADEEEEDTGEDDEDQNEGSSQMQMRASTDSPVDDDQEDEEMDETVVEDDSENQDNNERKCPVDGCHEKLPSEEELVVHMKKSHHAPLLCRDCLHPFPRGFNLRQHYRVHSGKKPFECGICEMKFTK